MLYNFIIYSIVDKKNKTIKEQFISNILAAKAFKKYDQNNFEIKQEKLEFKIYG